MPQTDTPLPGRRLSARTRLRPPMEARLSRGDEGAEGWIVDQQDDGLGLRFGHEDAARLLGDPEPWRTEPCHLTLLGPRAPAERLPVRVIHVTAIDPARRECVVGLVYDRRRMKAEQVLSLLETWQRFSSARV